jgi:hypothetical protein
MNQELKTKPMLVDSKAIKAKRINKKISKSLNQEWSFVPSIYTDFLRLVGNVLLIPVALVIGLLEGIHAGVIKGLEKTLSTYR